MSDPIHHEPVALNSTAVRTMVAIVEGASGSRVILLVQRKHLLKLEPDLIILSPHFSVAAPPAPLDYSGLLVTFPALVVVPYAHDHFGLVFVLSF